MATIITTKTKAPTQKEMFTKMIGVFEDIGGHDDLVQFCNERIEKLAKKAATSSSKKNEKDEQFFDLIADVLADGERKRATEIFNALTAGGTECSVQKVTAMLKKMVEAGRVTKTIEKKVTYFALAFGVDTEGEDGTDGE